MSGATVIQFALSGGTATAPKYMVEIGDSTICISNDCNGISVEHLRLDAANSTGTVVGIFNDVGQELNFVNDAWQLLESTVAVLVSWFSGKQMAMRRSVPCTFAR